MHKVTIFISTDGTELNGYSFDDYYIKSIKFSNQLMDTSFNINPCVIEQYAQVTFKDKNNYIFNLIKTGQLLADMKVFVYFDGVLKYTYWTSTWDIQLESTTIILNCNDPVKKLENIQTQLVNVSSRTLYNLFNIGFSLTPYSWIYADGDVGTLLYSTVVADSYISYQDLLSYLNKLCLVGFLRVYWHKDKFVVARCYK